MRSGIYQAGGLRTGFRGVGEIVSGDVLFDDVKRSEFGSFANWINLCSKINGVLLSIRIFFQP